MFVVRYATVKISSLSYFSKSYDKNIFHMCVGESEVTFEDYCRTEALSFLMFLSCLYNCGGKKVLHVGLQNFVRERWWYHIPAHFAATALEFVSRQLL